MRTAAEGSTRVVASPGRSGDQGWHVPRATAEASVSEFAPVPEPAAAIPPKVRGAGADADRQIAGTGRGAAGGLARNAFHLGLGQVFTTILTMALNAAIARTLGASDYGLLYLLQSIANFAYVFVDWGHGTYVTREVARHPERSGDLLGSVLVVRVISAVVVGAIAVAFTWVFGYDLRTRWFTALILVCWMPVYLSLTFGWIFRGRERMDCDALINTVLKLATLGMALSCLALGGRLLALLPMYALAGILNYVVALRVYHRLALPRMEVSRATAIELIRDGAPMLAISLAIAVQPYIDANVLYKLAPSDVVGWYGAAWIIAGTLVAPASILGATVYPRLSRSAGNAVEFASALQAGFRPLLLLAVLGGVGTLLFADFAIGVVYGSERYGPAAMVLKAFAPGLTLIYLDMLFGYAILALGKAAALAKAKAAAVIVTTGVELMLVPYFQGWIGNGGIGIVLSMAVGEFVMVVAALYLIRQLLTPAMAVDALKALLTGAGTILLFRLVPLSNSLFGIPLCILVFLGLAAALGLLRRETLGLVQAVIRR